jgi:hypothetical protein
MIHVFRENEEQLFKVSPRNSGTSKDIAGARQGGPPTLLSGECARGQMGALHLTFACFATQMIRMSTGHMEGNLQLLYVLLTDCYVYLLRKGACHPRPRAG